MPFPKELTDRFPFESIQDNHFLLQEFGAFGPSKAWELKSNNLFYTHTASTHCSETIQLTNLGDEIDMLESLFQLFSIWDFLQVWSWRNDYDGRETDGMSWKLTGRIGGIDFDAGGRNGFPSFESVEITSVFSQRYGLMLFGMLQAFRVDFDQRGCGSLAK